MRILIINGIPGVGKSTLMKKIIEPFGISNRMKYGLLEFMQFEKLNVLGYYEDGQIFGGVDRLSMSVQEDAITFLNNIYSFYPEHSLAFEGDRLNTTNVIKCCREVGDLRFVTLIADVGLIAKRRADRAKETGKEQNPVWIRGRESKVAKLSSDFFAEVRRVDTPEQSQELAMELSDWLRGIGEIKSIPRSLF